MEGVAKMFDLSEITNISGGMEAVLKNICEMMTYVLLFMYMLLIMIIMQLKGKKAFNPFNEIMLIGSAGATMKLITRLDDTVMLPFALSLLIMKLIYEIDL